MTKLDISAAWNSATRMVGANRDVLMAIAGVFFLLPNLAVAVFMGKPEIAPGTDPEKAATILIEAYFRIIPLLIVARVIQMVGIQTVLITMTDRARPTVARAIKRGFGATAPYLGSWILVWIITPLTFVMLASFVAALGIAVLTVTVGILLFAGFVWILLRTVLIAPVIACEDERNPIQAIRRSWDLTAGSALMLLVFFALAWLLFFVVYGLVMMFVGVVLVLATSGDLQQVLGAASASAMFSAWMVYLVAMTAAVHRQLAGPPAGEMGRAFE